MVGQILCTKRKLHSNHRLTRAILQHTKDFSPGAVISSLHTLVPPRGRNVNYDGKQLSGGKNLSFSFCLYRFGKYVSYGFPIINSCSLGVHYETSCTLLYNCAYQWITSCKHQEGHPLYVTIRLLGHSAYATIRLLGHSVYVKINYWNTLYM
jgi:hypothetical protein